MMAGVIHAIENKVNEKIKEFKHKEQFKRVGLPNRQDSFRKYANNAKKHGFENKMLDS